MVCQSQNMVRFDLQLLVATEKRLEDYNNSWSVAYLGQPDTIWLDDFTKKNLKMIFLEN